MLDRMYIRLFPKPFHSYKHQIRIIPLCGDLLGVTTRRLLGLVLLLGKANGRCPLGGVLGVRHLAVQLVDLLESQVLGLIDEEVDECDTDKACCEPDEEDLGLQVCVALAVVDQIRRSVGNSPVKKPL